ncbi:hypothetical protein CONCODRAFT_150831 [Conidiobolus coronatus NRRL 28638]|uniref:ABC transporter domain-containing protein n=1 Tax=Conidiobolus coronatus (strain ATCC 28846 / CBS 209.66 / NRRL 28638) TaxID=796925 RepID=A0A137P8N4_CONC2|nr:hypothetical protein CONCODRAFT_150831 [Conidiobolus coronatus NRRL 28638]|eukprot:KXN71339.1 hypothetical protein CONCODRAFT_150831 [Conidiobolus coronatus NRRL 28638]
MDYSGSILTYTMISVPIILGYYDDKSASELSALISLNTFQCMYLVYQLTTLLHQSETLSEWLGHSVRLNELIVQGLSNKLSEDEEIEIETDSSDDDDESRIELEQNLQLLSETQNDEELPIKINFVNVDLINYKNEFVLQNFNFELNSGENLIVRGTNGIGKSSLCKLITNVIKPTNGHIIRQNLNLPLDMMYFSQKLMIIEGTLIDQICYPNTPDYYYDSGFNLNDDFDINRLLKLVNLDENQFKSEQYRQSLNYQDWCNNYSLGTLQN